MRSDDRADLRRSEGRSPIRRLIISPAARRDLVDISTHSVRQWGVERAMIYRQALVSRIGGIRARPERGRSFEGLSPDYLFVASGRHFIFYRWNDAELQIVRVLHQSMDALRHLG